MPVDLNLDNTTDWGEVPCAKYFDSLADYEEALNKGEVDVNQVSVIAASNEPKFVCNSVDGTLSYTYNSFDYNEDGVQILDLSNTNAIYRAVYESLLKNHPEKRDEWQLLLKVNDNDYRLTVLQIEVAKGE